MDHILFFLFGPRTASSIRCLGQGAGQEAHRAAEEGECHNKRCYKPCLERCEVFYVSYVSIIMFSLSLRLHLELVCILDYPVWNCYLYTRTQYTESVWDCWSSGPNAGQAHDSRFCSWRHLNLVQQVKQVSNLDPNFSNKLSTSHTVTSQCRVGRNRDISDCQVLPWRDSGSFPCWRHWQKQIFNEAFWEVVKTTLQHIADWENANPDAIFQGAMCSFESLSNRQSWCLSMFIPDGMHISDVDPKWLDHTAVRFNRRLSSPRQHHVLDLRQVYDL